MGVGEKLMNMSLLKQTLVTFFGVFLNGVLGAIFYIIGARFLGPEQFGLFSIAVGVAILIADLTGIGTNVSLIKFISGNLGQTKIWSLVKFTLKLKLWIWIIILTLGYPLSYLLSTYLFHQTGLLTPLILSMVGVGSLSLFSFIISLVQALQKFSVWSGLNIFSNSVRLFFLVLINVSFGLNVISGLIVFIISPLFGILIGLFFIPIKKIIQASSNYQVTPEFFKYSKWAALSAIITAFYMRADVLLNASLLPASDVGIYSGASQLAIFMPQLIGALGVLSAPKFAAFKSKQLMFKFYLRFQLVVLFLAVCLGALIPASYFIIPSLLGEQYLLSIPVFIIIIISWLISLIAVPIEDSIRYFYGYTKFIAINQLIQISVFVLLGIILIPVFGVIGTPIAILIAAIINFTLSVVFLVKFNLKDE